MLGIPDEGRKNILHELEAVCAYANSYADRVIKAKLGRTNSAGNPIEYPLTESSTPPLTQSLLQNVYRLAEAYFRFRQADDPGLWDDATAKFDEAVDEEFGYTWTHGYTVKEAVSADRNPAYAGETIRLSGVHFRGRHRIIFVVEGTAPPGLQWPTTVSDVHGSWSAESTAIPAIQAGENGAEPGVGFLFDVTCADGDAWVEGEARHVSYRLQVKEGSRA